MGSGSIMNSGSRRNEESRAVWTVGALCAVLFVMLTAGIAQAELVCETVAVPPGTVDYGDEVDEDGDLADLGPVTPPPGTFDYGDEVDEDGNLINLGYVVPPPGTVDFGTEVDEDGVLLNLSPVAVPPGTIDFGVEIDDDGIILDMSAVAVPPGTIDFGDELGEFGELLNCMIVVPLLQAPSVLILAFFMVMVAGASLVTERWREGGGLRWS